MKIWVAKDCNWVDNPRTGFFLGKPILSGGSWWEFNGSHPFFSSDVDFLNIQAGECKCFELSEVSSCNTTEKCIHEWIPNVCDGVPHALGFVCKKCGIWR